MTTGLLAEPPNLAATGGVPPYGSSRHGSRASPLSLPRILFTAAVLVGLLLINKAGDIGAIAFFIILAVMAITSSKAAYQAIAICSLGLMINVGLVPKTIPWTLGRLIIPMIAMLRFAIDVTWVKKGQLALAPYAALMLFVATMAVCSILSGWFVQIALLKLFSFWLLMTTVIIGVVVLRASRIDLTEWFVSLITAATGMGFLAILTGFHNKSARFRGNTDVFLGAFLHPNCHSIYASLFVVLLLAIYMFTKYKHRWITIPLIGIWVVFMLWSKSRTAVVAALCGLTVLMWYAGPVRNRLGRWATVNLSRIRLIAVVALVLGGIAAYSAVRFGSPLTSIIGFINKSIAAEAVHSERVLASREGLIEFSWNNFLASPVYGIGFQVSKSADFAQKATLLTAPVEKGFLPTSILEEGGILGTTAFVLFLVAFIGDLVRQRNIPALAAFATMLGANMTEVSIFSLGGSGFFAWMMVGAATIVGDHIWIDPHTRR
jgi:hypothetical protein